MNKHFLLAVLSALIPFTANAQNVLEIEDLTQANDIYTSAHTEAQVVVICNKQIPLTFSSTMDKSAEPFYFDSEGNDSIYHIEFPTGSRYRGRQLSIHAPGYTTATFDLELEPKQLVTLKVFDPNSLVDAGCYRTHRNLGVAAIEKMNYEEAKNQFEVARQCSDVDEEENKANLQRADSLISLRRKADKAYQLLDYKEAVRLYNLILDLNRSDTYAEKRSAECSTRFETECSVQFKQAEQFFNERLYDRARILYEDIVRRGCDEAATAQDRLGFITTRQTMKKNHARVVTYEFMKGTPISLHYGSYKERKWGGYTAIHANKDVFKLVRKGDAQIGDVPEFTISRGWTSPAIAGLVHIYFTPFSATMKVYMGDYASGKYPDKDGLPLADSDLSATGRNGSYKDGQFTGMPNTDDSTIRMIDGKTMTQTEMEEYTQMNFAFAWSPEIGVLVKYSYAAIRLGYQQRFAIDRKLRDFMECSRFTFGIGLAF